MTTDARFLNYTARLREFIRRNSTHDPTAKPFNLEESGPQFNALALALFALQFEHNTVYRRFCEAQKVLPGRIAHWTELPAVPTVAFKELDLTSLPPAQRTKVFYSSGTSEQRLSRHYHNAESLAVYEASLLHWFKAHLLPDEQKLESQTAAAEAGRLNQRQKAKDISLKGEQSIHERAASAPSPLRMIFLTPPPTCVPHSSLAHMFAAVRQEFGAADSFFAGQASGAEAWTLDLGGILSELDAAVSANRPIVLLGTAFSFVHLLDHLAERQRWYQLPDGSRVMETGGYKGRTRSLPKADLHGLLSEHLGVPSRYIVCEYGMSELSSQAYDHVAGAELTTPSAARIFTFPPWARVQVIAPETGRAAVEGETGLIRVYDLANVHSVLAVQTEDLGVRRGGGFELIGRAASADPRGCSLMAV